MKSKITTYVVNLKKSIDRRSYIENLLSVYDFLNVEFVEAVYGKELSENELKLLFDEELAYKRYGRRLSRAEIGCTLSHYKCYEKLIESTKDYVLILEDDITILKDISSLPDIVLKMEQEDPMVLFLSGDYWYKSLGDIIGDYTLAKVYDAVGSYAYVINRAGAKLILESNKKPACVSDNWSLYRCQGLKMRAVYPYLIDANIESFESTIAQSYFGEYRNNMPIKMRIISYWNALVKKILLKQGKFVSKIRK